MAELAWTNPHDPHVKSHVIPLIVDNVDNDLMTCLPACLIVHNVHMVFAWGLWLCVDSPHSPQDFARGGGGRADNKGPAVTERLQTIFIF